MTSLLVVLAWANPPDADTRGAAVEAALNGPAGCWVASGTATWRTTGELASSSGEAMFESVFSDHRWGTYRYETITHTTVLGGEPLRPAPVRQFWLPLGNDPVIDHDVGPLHVWSTGDGASRPHPFAAPYALTEDGVRALGGPGGTSNASFHPDGGPRIVRIDLDHAWRTGRGKQVTRRAPPYGMEARFDAAGFPTRLEAWTSSESATITIRGFVPCTPDFVLPRAPIAGAFLDGERGEAFVADVVLRQRRLGEIASRHALGMRQGRRGTRNFIAALVSLGFGAALPASPLVRGLFFGYGAISGGIGLVDLFASDRELRRHTEDLARIARDANERDQPVQK